MSSDRLSFIKSNKLFFINIAFHRKRGPRTRERAAVGLMLDLDERIAVTRT
jgi:hypothetical protein